MSSWRKCDHCGKQIISKEGKDLEIFIGNRLSKVSKAILFGDICNGCIEDFVGLFESKGLVLSEESELHKERSKSDS